MACCLNLEELHYEKDSSQTPESFHLFLQPRLGFHLEIRKVPCPVPAVRRRHFYDAVYVLRMLLKEMQ